MVEKQCSAPGYKKQVRQQGTVPFLWEEIPGTPKKDWKPDTVSVNCVPSPVKLVTMVPFKWEEKPGKPLPSFSYSQGDSPVLPHTYSPVLPLPPSKLIGFTRSSGYSLHSSPIKVGAKLKTLFSRIINYEEEDIGDVDNKEENDSEPKVDQEDGVLKEESEDVAEEDTGEVDDDKEENDSEPKEHHQDGSLKEESEDDNAEEEDDDATDDNGEGEEEMLELDAEATNFGKSESSRSVMSLLANCCIAQEDISNAIPVEQYLMEQEISHIQHESPTSPLFASETESYFSSNATESSSSSRLTGSSSFFECFFPQFSPDPGYLDNADSHEESALIPPHLFESNLPLRTPTLGELIRVSCRGFRTRNPSLDFMKKGFGSCISETGDKAHE